MLSRVLDWAIASALASFWLHGRKGHRMKRVNAWANRNPLLAVWIGFAVCFALTYLTAPLIVRHIETTTHSRGNT